MEAAPEQVVHAAGGHPVERLRRHREGFVIAGADVEAEQELQRRRGWKLGCAAEAAPLRVELAAEPHDRLAELRLRQGLSRGCDRRGLPQRLDDGLRLAGDVGRAVAVRVGDRGQELTERRQPVPRLGREVRAAEKRFAVRQQEHRHRPAAVAGQGDDGIHVDGVDVGPLLAVDLDVHEPVVHERRRLLVLEGLVRHHVAPVTGRVADREQNRPVLGAGARQRLLAPRVPVDRVVGVLEQVRARLAREPVHAGGNGPAR